MSLYIPARKTKYKLQLACYNVSDEIFSKIYDYVPKKYFKTVSKAEMNKYQYGAPSKRTVYFNGSDMMVVPDWVLDVVLGEGQTDFPYKSVSHQVILYLKHNMTKRIEHTISGMRANRAMRRLLRKAGYSLDDIEQLLRSHAAIYNNSQKQLHYLRKGTYPGKISKYANCAEFDINSAYCSILIEIFPKARKLLEKAYNERKIRPENKAMFNYFVGMLARTGYRETYNYIVQAVTRKLNDFIEKHGGWDKVVYANTDGVVMMLDESMTYETSHRLGDFKIESQGDCYVYKTDNYWAMQVGDKMVGSLLWQARKSCDLSKNVVVSYDRTEYSKESDLDNSQTVRWVKADNITQHFPGIYEEYKESKKNEDSEKNIQDKVRKDGDEDLHIRSRPLFIQEVQEFIARAGRQTRRRQTESSQ